MPLCFLDDVERAFREAYRVIRVARFYSVAEARSLLKKTGFRDFSFTQTIFQNLDAITAVEPVKAGFGEGAFVVVKATKPL